MIKLDKHDNARLNHFIEKLIVAKLYLLNLCYLVILGIREQNYHFAGAMIYPVPGNAFIPLFSGAERRLRSSFSTSISVVSSILGVSQVG